MRPSLPSDPPTLLGVMGAAQLTGDAADVAAFPFLAKPGPEVPFVLPSVLERPDVLAIASAQLVGTHAGFAIAYLIEPGASRAGVAAIPSGAPTRPTRSPVVRRRGSSHTSRRTRSASA